MAFLPGLPLPSGGTESCTQGEQDYEPCRVASTTPLPFRKLLRERNVQLSYSFTFKKSYTVPVTPAFAFLTWYQVIRSREQFKVYSLILRFLFTCQRQRHSSQHVAIMPGAV